MQKRGEEDLVGRLGGGQVQEQAARRGGPDGEAREGPGEDGLLQALVEAVLLSREVEWGVE